MRNIYFGLQYIGGNGRRGTGDFGWLMEGRNFNFLPRSLSIFFFSLPPFSLLSSHSIIFLSCILTFNFCCVPENVSVSLITALFRLQIYSAKHSDNLSAHTHTKTYYNCDAALLICALDCVPFTIYAIFFPRS